MRRLIRLGVALSVLLAFSATTFAQQGTAELVGKVTDSQGAVLPGVAIVITND